LAYIKIDVEGFEYDVLRGGEALLKNHKVYIIQLEIIDQIKNSGRNVHELVNLLKQYGYELYKYNAKEKKLLAITYSENRDNYFAIYNIEKVIKRLNNA
jgi:hypothetical protein